MLARCKLHQNPKSLDSRSLQVNAVRVSQFKNKRRKGLKNRRAELPLVKVRGEQRKRLSKVFLTRMWKLLPEEGEAANGAVGSEEPGLRAASRSHPCDTNNEKQELGTTHVTSIPLIPWRRQSKKQAFVCAEVGVTVP